MRRSAGSAARAAVRQVRQRHSPQHAAAGGPPRRPQRKAARRTVPACRVVAGRAQCEAQECRRGPQRSSSSARAPDPQRPPNAPARPPSKGSCLVASSHITVPNAHTSVGRYPGRPDRISGASHLGQAKGRARWGAHTFPLPHGAAPVSAITHPPCPTRPDLGFVMNRVDACMLTVSRARLRLKSATWEEGGQDGEEGGWVGGGSRRRRLVAFDTAVCPAASVLHPPCAPHTQARQGAP